MEQRLPVRIIGGCFALTAFAVAILAGLGSDVPAAAILWRATMSLVVGYAAGLVVGLAADCAVHEHVANYMKEHPMSPGGTSPPASGAAGGVSAQSSQGEPA